MYEIISNPSNKLGIGKVVLDEVEPCSFEELLELCELAEAPKTTQGSPSNSTQLLVDIADADGPQVAVKKEHGREPSLREIIRQYYHAHDMENPAKCAARYIAQHGN